MREIEDLQEEKNDLAAGWIAADKTIAAQQARIADLEQQLADLLEAVLAYVGPVDDPHIGWRGSSPSHNDLFQCEACGAEDADTRAMQHTDNCTAAALLATIGQKP